MDQEANQPRKDFDRIVENAVLDLERRGHKATVAAVVEKTGGSRRDIAPAVRRAKEKLQQRHEQLMAIPDMPDKFQAAMSDLWIDAFEAASVDFRTLQSASQAQIVRQKDEIEELYEIISEAESEAEGWRKKFERAEQLVTDQKNQISSLKQGIEIAAARLSERDDLVAMLRSDLQTLSSAGQPKAA